MGVFVVLIVKENQALTVEKGMPSVYLNVSHGWISDGLPRPPFIFKHSGFPVPDAFPGQFPGRDTPEGAGGHGEFELYLLNMAKHSAKVRWSHYLSGFSDADMSLGWQTSA